MKKQFIEIISRRKKIELNREGIICPQNPYNSDGEPDMEYVNEAKPFIARFYGIRKLVNKFHFSYGLKAVYEMVSGNYIANGDFIYAMHLCGFDIIPCGKNSRNCWFNILTEIPQISKKLKSINKDKGTNYWM